MRELPHGHSFRSHPLFILALSLATGIFAGQFPHLSLGVSFACSAIFVALTILHLKLKKLTHAALMLVLAFFAAGVALEMLEKSSVRADRIERLFDEGLIASGDPVELTGVLTEAPEPAPESFYLKLAVEKLSFKGTERAVSGTVWLIALVRNVTARRGYEALELRYGARLRLMVHLNRAESFQNPGVSSLTEYLERRGFDATGTIKSPLLIERLDDKRVFLPLAFLYEWRQRLLAEINQTFNAKTAGVLDAALLGNRYHLSHDVAERFRVGSTFHVLVISGLHISFIGALIFFITSRMTKNRAAQFFISSAILWSYTFAVGAQSSVTRAALMFTLVALAPLLSRRANSLNALGAAALLLLVFRPDDLFDPSFQLTFLSALAIVALAWPLLETLCAVGQWRLTRETPLPPDCPRIFRTLGETLFWSEREFQRETARSIYSYKLFKTPLAPRLERWHLQAALRFTFSAVIISTIVQLFLLPLQVIYFHRLSFAALLLNIIVGILMAATALISLAALLLNQFSHALASPLIHFAQGLNFLMVHSVDPFMRLHIASLRLPEYPGLMSGLYVLYYAPLIIIAIALARWNPLRPEMNLDETRRRKNLILAAALAFSIAVMLIVFHPLSAPRPDGRLHIAFLDVGQGDAALLTMPDGTTLLVDAGGRVKYGVRKPGTDEDDEAEAFERDARSIGDAVVSEYLWHRGLDRVDYVLATHADADHISGLSDVMKNFRVRAAIAARAPLADPEYRLFATAAAENGVPIYLTARGDEFHFDAVKALVLWPPATNNKNAPSRNNDSLVFRVTDGERTFLLTGDVEKEAEAALANARDDLRADVVKVAHHGSRTSSTESVVNATRPQFAIISVGLSSIFGHPHQEVLERWRASGAQVLTTGRSGTINVSTDGKDLRVETYLSGKQ